MTKNPILKSDDFFKLKRVIEARISEMETRDHWCIVGYTPEGFKYEGSPLQQLHTEIHQLKKSLEKFGELFEFQYK